MFKNTGALQSPHEYFSSLIKYGHDFSSKKENTHVAVVIYTFDKMIIGMRYHIKERESLYIA